VTLVGTRKAGRRPPPGALQRFQTRHHSGRLRRKAASFAPDRGRSRWRGANQTPGKFWKVGRVDGIGEELAGSFRRAWPAATDQGWANSHGQT